VWDAGALGAYVPQLLPPTASAPRHRRRVRLVRARSSKLGPFRGGSRQTFPIPVLVFYPAEFKPVSCTRSYSANVRMSPALSV
jgi:hypothetical protein